MSYKASFNNYKILGFSLIELMIVIAIIGILAAIAVLSYRNYIIRTKISAIIAGLTPYTNKVQEQFEVTESLIGVNATITVANTTSAGFGQMEM